MILKTDFDYFLRFYKGIVLLFILVVIPFFGFAQSSTNVNALHFSIEDESVFRRNGSANSGLNIFRFNVQTPTSSPIPLQVGFDYASVVYPNVNGRFTNFRFNLNTEKYRNELSKLRQKEDSPGKPKLCFGLFNPASCTCANMLKIMLPKTVGITL
jgi:hypothetical protein